MKKLIIALMLFGSVGHATSQLIENKHIKSNAAIAYSKLNLAGAILGSDVSTSAAIPYSKLNLNNSIVSNDISISSPINYSRLLLTGSVVNADIVAAAGIPYSKLTLTGTILGADLSATANIPYSKLSIGSSLKDSDFSNSSAVNYSRLLLTGSVVNADIATTAAIALSKIGSVGAIGHVVASNGSAWIDSTIPVVPSQAISSSNIDWSTGNLFYKTLTANTTFTFSGKSDGQTIVVKVRNPASFTVAFPLTLGGESVMWTGSVVPVATTGNKISVFTFVNDSVNKELVGSFLGAF